jgi:hypothetical protein
LAQVLVVGLALEQNQAVELALVGQGLVGVLARAPELPVGVLALKLEGLGAVSLGSALFGPAVVVRGVPELALVVVWLGPVMAEVLLALEQGSGLVLELVAV